MMTRECVPGLCLCSNGLYDNQRRSLCDNTVIQRQHFPRCEVYPTPGCGHGLRLCDAVPAHTIITEYLGEVITSEEMKQRMSTYTANNHFYFANLGDGLYLDASNMGSIARFANHSCDPTCQMQKWTVLGESRIVLTSLRALEPGSEITYIYNFESIGDGSVGTEENLIYAQPCRCGSWFCSGRVGKPPKAWDKLIQGSEEKVKDFKAGSRQVTIDSLLSMRKELEELPSSAKDQLRVVQLRDEITSLEIEVESWMSDFRAFELNKLESLTAASPCLFLSLEEVEALLQRSPEFLRCDEKKVLKEFVSVVHMAIAAVKSIQEKTVNFRSIVLPHVNNVDRHQLSLQNPSLWLSWTEIRDTLKLVRSALPVYLSGVEEVLREYFTLCQWCYEHLYPFISSLRLPRVKDKEGSVGARTVRSYDETFPLAQKICQSYSYCSDCNVIDSRRNDNNNDDGKVRNGKNDHHWLFRDVISECVEYLDERLTVYMLTHRSESISLGLTPKDLQLIRKRSPIVCYCCIYEDSGDSPFYVQCSGCALWCHLDCMNFPSSYSLDLKAVQFFLCPHCLLGHGLLSNFALPPETEWKSAVTCARQATQRSSLAKAKEPNRLRSSELKTTKAVVHDKGGKVSVETVSVAIEVLLMQDSAPMADKEAIAPEGATLKHVREEGEISAGNQAPDQVDQIVPASAVTEELTQAEETESKGLAQLVNNIRRLEEQSPSLKMKHYVNCEDLHNLLISSHPLPLQDNPVTALLHMCQRFVRGWIKDVEARCYGDLLPDMILYLETLLYAQSSSSLPSSVDNGHESGRRSVWLRRLLESYFQLSILRVKVSSVLAPLRMVIWVLSASVILDPSSRPQSSVVIDNKVTIEEMERVLQGGKGVYKETVRVLRSGTLVPFIESSTTLESLKKMTELVKVFVERVEKQKEKVVGILRVWEDCRDTLQARVLLQQLSICPLMMGQLGWDYRGHFQYARLCCWARSQRVVEVSTTLDEVRTIEVIENSPSILDSTANCVDDGSRGDEKKQLFCWCRQGDEDQLDCSMICCDGCNEWFHYQCVGLHEPKRRSGARSVCSSCQETVGHSWKVLELRRTLHATRKDNNQTARRVTEGEAYFCISCSELLKHSYPFSW
eukprot:scaffold2414_cov164-Ochromonas_danica.AAC.2